ncbi:alpha/beta fold hydrolase [Streptomyces alanosinicus]|uniref:alpha/beta fold hydrolase n=1 Tax=Streptomyces alanosinicus TaxID=68171 RepID=UPI001E5A19C5|nr:alpha/beta fold hydrolase [Streptomyces alanosinicus]
MPSAVNVHARALPGYPGPRHWRQVPVTGQHYVDVGSGDLVLFLHGNPTWSYLWRSLLGTLSSDFRCIAPDLAGFGLSPRFLKPQRGADCLEQQLACLDHLFHHLTDVQGLPACRWTLVVHDWGGPIGIAWALRHPGVVARLVVLNSVAFPWPAGYRLPMHMRWIRDSAPAAALARAGNVLPRAAVRLRVVRRLSEAERMAYLLPFADAQNRGTVVEFVQSIPQGDGDPVWRLLKAPDAESSIARLPIFIGWGMRDRLFTPAVLDEWIRRFPQARVRRYGDAGHFVMEDAGGELDRHVRDFLLGA